MLRYLFLTFILLIHGIAKASDSGIIGEVNSVPGCSKQVMVWLSLDEVDYQKRLLLLHTLVPVKGKFQFYLKPGNYQLRATDDKGCEFFQRIKIGNSLNSISVRMKK